MRRSLVSLVFLGAACCSPVLADDAPRPVPEEVVVVGVAPVMGSGVDRDKLPVNVQVIDPQALRGTAPASAADMLGSRLGSVSTADYAGNALQPSLSFRGFNASPTLGDPEGLAVYQNGMRLNESFGDLVNWDMNPSFAIDKIQVLPGSNPVFGLNALGGAVTLKMKDGFSNQGTDGEIAGGSFGRARTMVETGRQFGPLGFYTGVSMQTDDGWRQSSHSKLIQSYTDIALRKEALEVGVGLTLAASDLSGLGTSPVQLLAQSRSAVFSSPDKTQNALAALDLRGTYDLSDTTSLQGNAYYRHLRTGTHNGDASGIAPCADDADSLCDSNGPIADRSGNAVSSALVGNGLNNNTVTLTQAMGASAQVTHDGRAVGHDNHLVFGVSTDQGWTDYHTNAELGALSSLRAVVGSGVYLGGSSYAVSLGAHSAYWGAYVTDTFSLTDHLHLTAAGRFNLAQEDLQDRLGSGLNGNHDYRRFNPSLGLAWQVTDGLTTYANYSEANRVPTAAELSCADPNLPCRVPNAFVSDPDLKQVIARSWEIGARGKLPMGGADKVEWSLAAFTTRNTDDIIFVSSGTLPGSGYFTNAGATLRQGLEAGVEARLGAWRLFADYGLVRATFDSPLTIQSPDNSGADANGNIAVKPGDRLPGIPLHALKLGAQYAVSERWSVGSDVRISSDRVIRGDESNSMPKIPGFAVVNAATSYTLCPGAEVFLRVQNIFDRKYATAGTLGNPSSIFPSFTDPRFESPGEPRSFWAGVRMTF